MASSLRCILFCGKYLQNFAADLFRQLYTPNFINAWYSQFHMEVGFSKQHRDMEVEKQIIQIVSVVLTCTPIRSVCVLL